MSRCLGNCFCKDTVVAWEVWSNGKAYGDNGSVAYRHQDGQWRTSLVSSTLEPVEATEKLENLFSKYLATIIVGPLDPLRHLRRK